MSNQNQDYNKKFPQLGDNSTEWIQLEYDLQLGLGSISAQIKEIKAINNQSLQFQFEKHNQNKLIIDSWIDQNKLSEYFPIQEICYKGFEFKDNKGYVFPTGFIDIEHGDNIKSKQQTIIMFKIAVGKSQCVPCRPEDINQQKNYQKESNFDSIYLYDDEQDKKEGVFLHRYVIFEKEQVLPMYLIKFEFDETKESQLQPTSCNNCETNQAKVYCQNDEAYFCTDCSYEIHQSNQSSFSNKHKLIDISKKEKSFGSCQIHSETKLELYCMICHLALCVYCKIQGSHSQGEPSAHQLVKISDAYKKAIHESKVLDPQLEKRKNELTDYLNHIDQKIKDVGSKAAQIEEKIYKLLQDGLELLQEKTKEKMCILIGDQLELKRQYDQISWMEQFLKYQQNVLNPADYLKAWSRHSALRNKIIAQESKSMLYDVNPDFICEVTPIVIKSDNGSQNPTNPSNDKNNQDIGTYNKTSSTAFRTQILQQKNSTKIMNDRNDRTQTMSSIVPTVGKNQSQIRQQAQFSQTTGIKQSDD